MERAGVPQLAARAALSHGIEPAPARHDLLPLLERAAHRARRPALDPLPHGHAAAHHARHGEPRAGSAASARQRNRTEPRREVAPARGRDRGRDRQSRFLPGRARHPAARGQHAIRALLSREAPVLPGGRRHPAGAAQRDLHALGERPGVGRARNAAPRQFRRYGARHAR